jgi:hypothetical protein
MHPGRTGTRGLGGNNRPSTRHLIPTAIPIMDMSLVFCYNEHATDPLAPVETGACVMNFNSVPALVALTGFAATAAFGAASSAAADELVMLENVPTYGPVPHNGMSMAEVERRFGAPDAKLPVAGGDTPLHPPINRWRYAGYTVYFERNIVLHSVRDRVVASGS